jgi:3-carboxy-cis,cis-muconate cycloisomerase
MAILARQTLQAMDHDITRITAVLLQLTRLHADTPVLERVNFQSVAVSSFGWKCAQWLASLVRCQNGLRAHAHTALRVLWGHGLAGDSEIQGKAPAILAQLSRELGLDAADALHLSALQEWLALGCEVALLAGVLGQMGSELACMGQHEIGEISAPVAAFLDAMDNARCAPQRVAALLALASQGQEGSEWQVELAPWSQLVLTTRAAASAMGQCMAVLQVDAVRMRLNVESLLKTLPQQTPGSHLDLAHATQASAWSRKYLEAVVSVGEKMP